MELKHYFKILLRKLWLIVAIVLIGCIITAAKSYYFTTAIYQANAKLIVNQASLNDPNALPSVGSLQTDMMLINTYKEIIKSPAIMNKVVEQNPQLQISPMGLSASTTVVSANESQIVNLMVSSTSYEKAAEAVNAIAKVFKSEIPTIMNVNNVTILSEAVVGEAASPINMSSNMDFVVAIVLSLLIAGGLVFLLDYLDNTYKSESELIEDLGLPMLAIVTKINKGDLKSRNKPPASKNQKVGEGTYATINQ
ncbi:YveK family protein [Paenibacillus solisilvae]|uniref:YveK family protein n=1 Tax=Paenibacillus solisilvae TaxID=2486751 RepID=A0ABW0W748_9BACL